MKRLNALPLGLYEKAICFSLAWEEKLSLVKEAGYDFLEINIDGEEPRINRLYDQTAVKDLNRALLNTGVPVLSMALTANRKYPLGSEDERTRLKGIELVKRAVDFALTAGIRIIQLAPYCGGSEEPGEQAKNRLYTSTEQCLAYAQACCVTLSFEGIDTQMMRSIKQIMEFVRALDSPFFQAYADIGNLHAMGVDVAEDLTAGGRHVLGVHIKDSKPLVVRDVPYGKGIVDFQKSFRTLSQMEYGGILVAEMWCHEDAAFHPYLKKANRFIKQAIAPH
jgi:predicted hexulose-6-phosphate isomerase